MQVSVLYFSVVSCCVIICAFHTRLRGDCNSGCDAACIDVVDDRCKLSADGGNDRQCFPSEEAVLSISCLHHQEQSFNGGK